MTTLILLAGAYCVAASLLHFTSIFVVIRRFLSAGVPASGSPYAADVAIIRPVCGIENFAERTLSSAFHLDPPCREIIHCVAHHNDPVIPLVERLIIEHPQVPARLLIGNDRISSNPKLNNVVKGWHAAERPWIVMADSNALLPPDFISRQLAAWRSDTGFVCSPPIGCAPDGVWAELECAFLNTYQARWQCFVDSAGLGFAQGKTMLWRRDILEAGGGIEALGAQVAEDAAATKLVRQQGLRVRVVDRPFEQPLGHRTAIEFWRRQLRWARLRRDSFKLLFACEILSGGVLPLAACAFWMSGIEGPLIAAVALLAFAWYGAEALLAFVAGWHFVPRSIALWVLRDLMIPAVWFAGWLGNDFVWRGNAMRVAVAVKGPWAPWSFTRNGSWR